MMGFTAAKRQEEMARDNINVVVEFKAHRKQKNKTINISTLYVIKCRRSQELINCAVHFRIKRSRDTKRERERERNKEKENRKRSIKCVSV